MIAVMRTGEHNIRPMPPDRPPYKPLEAWEVEALRKWIELGAPD